MDPHQGKVFFQEVIFQVAKGSCEQEAFSLYKIVTVHSTEHLKLLIPPQSLTARFMKHTNAKTE